MNDTVINVNKKFVFQFTQLQQTLLEAETVPFFKASHSYWEDLLACVLVRLICKIALQFEKTYYVLRFEVSKSVITMQREFRVRFNKNLLHKNNIKRWYGQFMKSRC